ncbi:MAG: transglycosylase SLT domain-containing protein [Myxococcota bacterium]
MSSRWWHTRRASLRAVAGRLLRAGLALAVSTLLTVALVDGGRLVAAWSAFRNPGRLDGRPPPAPTRLAPAPNRTDRDGALDAALAAEFTDVNADVLADLELVDLRAADLDVPLTRRTLRFVRFFAREPAGRRVFEIMLRRAGRYREVVEPALRHHQLPTDLQWVAAVESLFDPTATSPAGAAGMWQFMAGTARSYGLEVHAFVDERRHVARATSAAARHLRDLVDELGRLDLALAADNAGRERIGDAIARYRALHPHAGSVRFADLARAGLLPRETVDYVPKVAAVAIVAAHRARFGFGAVVPDPPRAVAAVTVPAETRLATVARAAGISLGELRALNPEFRQARLPAGRERAVAVPADRRDHVLVTLSVYLTEEAHGGNFVAASKGASSSRVVVPDAMLPPVPAEPAWRGPAPLVLDVPRLDGPRNDIRLLSLPPVGAAPVAVGTLARYLVSSPPAAPTPVSAEARAAIEDALGAPAGTQAHERDVAGVALTVRPTPAARTFAFRAEVGNLTVRVTSPDLDRGLHEVVGQVAWLHEAGRGLAGRGLRARLNRHRRVALGQHPDGAAFLALSDALAPGALIDPRGPNLAWVRDRLTLDRLRGAQAVRLDVAGPTTADEVETMVASLVGPRGWGKEGHEPAWDVVVPWEGDILRVEGRPRWVGGWRAPGLTSRDHGVLRVVAELLRRALAEDASVTDAEVFVDPDLDRSTLVVAVTPGVAPPGPVVRAALDALGGTPSPEARTAVARAKAHVGRQIKRALRRTTLNPTQLWATHHHVTMTRLLGAVGAVGPGRVRTFVASLPAPTTVISTPARALRAAAEPPRAEPVAGREAPRTASERPAPASALR